MSFRTSRGNTTTSSKILKGPLTQPGQWVRNPEWMPMPATTAAQEQVDLLVAVYPESPYIAFNFQTTAGTYTVDWGDGSAPVNVASGITTQYLYDYNAAGLTGPGTLSYKQAMVKVTPTTGGATFSNFNINLKNTTPNLQAYTQPILDLTISCNATVMTIGGATVPLRLMERCTILRHNTTNMTSMFSGCSSLQSVPLFNTASVNTMASMFQSCGSLVTVPLFNTINVTTMASMFSGCSSLQSVPLFNTANVTIMQTMFSGCTALQSVPLFNTANVTIMSNMFQSCSSLQSVPLFNTANVNTMSQMFLGTAALPTGIIQVPLFNTANVTNMTSMFSNCPALQSVPLFNTVKVTNFSSMFTACSSLISVPAFNTAGVTGTTAFTTMFNNCPNLQQLPDINYNVAAITTNASYSNMFATCSSLSKIGTGAANTGPKFTFSVASCKLSAAALNALYTSLPTVTAQTITTTGNVGKGADTPSIATSKGWTVV
jgi:surface protein